MIAENYPVFDIATWALIIGVLVGALFGIFGEISKFCLRRALAGVAIDRASAASVWLAGLFMALIGTQALITLNIIDLSTHRLLAADIPWLAAILGGAIFGIGMVLTRGCISRLTILTGTGNLRALTVIVIFGLIANATIRGFFAPLRVAATTPKLTLASGDLSAFVGIWPLIIAVAGLLIWSLRRQPQGHYNRVIFGAAIGLLVPLTWYLVSVQLADPFDPAPIEGISFTLPHANTLLYLQASSAITVDFSIGLIVGVITGAFISALAFKRLAWQSFTTPQQTLRYGLGAVCMGFGGVLAGGCTVGAGLSGVSMQSITAIIAIISISIAAYVAGRVFP